MTAVEVKDFEQTLAMKLVLTATIACLALVAAARPLRAQADHQVSLQEAIDRSLKYSLSVQQAEHELQGQVERRRGSWSDVGPRVILDYNYVKFEEAQTANFGGNEITIRPDKSNVGSVTVAQPITGAGALIKNALLQGTLEEAKTLGLRLAKSATTFGTAEAYLRALAAQRQVEIAEASILAAEGQARDAAALERVGRMNRGDVLRLDLAVSEAKTRAAQARAASQIALVALRETIGIPQQELLNLDQNPPGVSEPETSDLDQMVKLAMTRRVDDDQAQLGVEAAEFGKALAWSGFSPSVNVFMKHERNFGEPAGFGGGEKDTRTYGIQASWTIWENGSKVFALRAAAEDIAKAEAGREALLQGIRLEMAQLLANLATAKESLQLAELAVQQAEEAYRIEHARFKTGSRSPTDLILAETSRSGAQGRLVTAHTELAVLYLNLQKALGHERPLLATTDRHSMSPNASGGDQP